MIITGHIWLSVELDLPVEPEQLHGDAKVLTETRRLLANKLRSDIHREDTKINPDDLMVLWPDRFAVQTTREDSR